MLQRRKLGLPGCVAKVTSGGRVDGVRPWYSPFSHPALHPERQQQRIKSRDSGWMVIYTFQYVI